MQRQEFILSAKCKSVLSESCNYQSLCRKLIGIMKTNLYYIYITTNPGRTVLYIGVTSTLKQRLQQHYEESLGAKTSFAGKYCCYNLVYYETFQYINDAIKRETELKKWSRAKKEALIATKNPAWDFLNNALNED